jgi:O-antigen/teichoic acid export membrane protein
VLSLFQSSWLFITLMSIAVVGGLGAALVLFGLGWLFDVSAAAEGDARTVLLLLLAAGLVNFQTSFGASALRATGRMAEATFAFNVASLAESSAIAGALLFRAGPVTVALISLAGRFCAFTINRLLLGHYAPALRYGVAQARWDEIRRLFVPSVTYLFFPAGNAAILQGIVIVLGHTLGPASVAVFSTTRTAANVMVQLTGLFSWASWPEISRQFGLQRRDLVAAYLTHGMQISAIVAAVLGLILIAAAPIIFSVWTAGRVAPDRMLVALLTVASAMRSLHLFPTSILLATNQHVRYGFCYLAICLTVIGLVYMGSRTLDLAGAAAALLAGETAILLLSTAFVLAVVGEGTAPLKRILTTRPPIERLLIR